MFSPESYLVTPDKLFLLISERQTWSLMGPHFLTQLYMFARATGLWEVGFRPLPAGQGLLSTHLLFPFLICLLSSSHPPRLLSLSRA